MSTALFPDGGLDMSQVWVNMGVFTGMDITVSTILVTLGSYLAWVVFTRVFRPHGR